MPEPQTGELSWKLSSHPITLLCFLGFRICKQSFDSLTRTELTCGCSQPVGLHSRPLVHSQLVRTTHIVLANVALTCDSILIFIITVILLAIDFYYLKNIAGRRLVGLRWWNEVDPATGDSKWVFESADPETRTINATDKRFFWLALYAQPALWILLGVVAIIKLISFVEITPLWLTRVGKLLCTLEIYIRS